MFAAHRGFPGHCRDPGHIGGICGPQQQGAWPWAPGVGCPTEKVREDLGAQAWALQPAQVLPALSACCGPVRAAHSGAAGWEVTKIPPGSKSNGLEGLLLSFCWICRVSGVNNVRGRQCVLLLVSPLLHLPSSFPCSLLSGLWPSLPALSSLALSTSPVGPHSPSPPFSLFLTLLLREIENTLHLSSISLPPVILSS